MCRSPAIARAAIAAVRIQCMICAAHVQAIRSERRCLDLQRFGAGSGEFAGLLAPTEMLPARTGSALEGHFADIAPALIFFEYQ